MQCLLPRNVKVKTSSGYMQIPAPCGRCPNCLRRQRQEWFIRNKIELQNSLNGFFVTLTYDESYLPRSHDGLPCFSVEDIQKWLKRFRKAIKTPGIKYFLASEYGDKFGRPHYHALLYNIPKDYINELATIISNTWQKGFVSVNKITDARIGYVTKYLLARCQRKKDFNDPALAPFYLSSRRPAIGSSYLTDDNILYHLGNKTTSFNLFGLKTTLPSYYKRKIFDCYPEIKQEIRNDYLVKVAKEMLPIVEDDNKHHEFSLTNRQRVKDSFRHFKSVSSKKITAKLPDF